MTIKPLSDHILIESISNKEKTDSGFFVPQSADKEGPEEAKVIAVGPGKTVKGEKIPVAVKIGDKILFSKPYGVSKIKAEGKDLLIIKEDDILAILE
ncbi:MAG: co-chaperone GroES [Candidatus Pacebacteria bacterium]|nr:co-chaperone GroES [Candidatus Paceibacterota bacterium]